MTGITRRNVLKCGAFGGAMLLGSGLLNPASAEQELGFKPEEAAQRAQARAERIDRG